MKIFTPSFGVIFALQFSHCCQADEYASPDHNFNIVVAEPVAQEVASQFQLQHATLMLKKAKIWEYASISRSLQFSWSPDSRHFLFAQDNTERDMSLFLIAINDDNSPRLQEIDLNAVHRAIIAPIPQFYNRLGGYAPVQYIDWKTIRWTSETRCQFLFIDRNTGLNSEAKVEIDFSKQPPKFSILSMSDKLEKHSK